MDEWKISNTIPILKKRRKSDPENYRYITLLTSTHKLLTKIVLFRSTSK